VFDIRGIGHSSGMMLMPIRRIRSACCARTASGHVATPPRSVMNARRLNSSDCIGSPASQGRIAGYRIGGDQFVKASTEVVKKNYAAGVQTSCWLNLFN
jgi:hypothetical protein